MCPHHDHPGKRDGSGTTWGTFRESVSPDPGRIEGVEEQGLHAEVHGQFRAHAAHHPQAEVLFADILRSIDASRFRNCDRGCVAPKRGRVDVNLRNEVTRDAHRPTDALASVTIGQAETVTAVAFRWCIRRGVARE